MSAKIKNRIFIFTFLFLYALVAFISFCHAIEFFNIGNVEWMSVMLAFAFELGLAVCLGSILIGTNKHNNIAWILLTLLVFVQVVGNTYSVFKFISESEVDYYNYLAKPLLFWIQEVSQDTVQIIVSWIMGAILPIVALLMTEMVANGIKEQEVEEVKDDEDNGDVPDNVVYEPKAIDPPIVDTSSYAGVFDEPEQVVEENDDSGETLEEEPEHDDVIDPVVETNDAQKDDDKPRKNIIDFGKKKVDVVNVLERDAEVLNPELKKKMAK